MIIHDPEKKRDTGRYLCLILRHHPEVIGITLDEYGWADTAQLIAGVNRTHPLDIESLEDIVKSDEKQRYSWNEDHTKIRAAQGHSIPVDVGLQEKEPPEILYHGSAEKYRQSIEQQGLLPRSRLYVHLSKDKTTAVNTGKRHGRPVVYLIMAGEMYRCGYPFFLSQNGIWLTKEVPYEFMKRI